MAGPRISSVVSAAIPSGFAMTTSANAAERKKSLKGARLRKHADYQHAYAASRKRQSASMSWFMAPQPTLDSHHPADGKSVPSARVGLTAGKVLGRSHERNRIKRRMRDALRRHVDLLPPRVDIIFHPRRTVLTMEFAKLEAEIVRILTQARAEAQRVPQHAGPVEPLR